jgi:PHD/YefM family antitoxin component YafN of YafNO toxin-antitoxin module
MRTKRVSVAEGKQGLSSLLREARRTRVPIVIYNKRRGEVAGVLLSPMDYDRYTDLRALFEALRLSRALSTLDLNAMDLARQSRQDLAGRTS